MPRPRSILGLLLHLVALHARRRPVWTLVAALFVVAVVAVSVRPRSPHAAQDARGGVQVAVLQGGFLVTHPVDGGRRVIEVDADGRPRGATTVRHAEDQRIVGTTAGAAVAWQEAKKLRLARVEDGRDLGTWGKAVRQLCDGVASNAARFAVGWLESNDAVWIVHGPVADDDDRAAAAEAFAIPEPTPELARSEWCGVASAEQNIALLWRTADKLKFGMCTKRRCSSLIATFRLDRRLPILGAGCLSNACLVASRDDAGNARLALLTETSKTRWTRPLDTPGSAVAIAGIGDEAFAVGHVASAGAEVVRIDRAGAVTSVWRDPAATGAPALAWSSGRLLIAYHQGDALVHVTIPLAR